MFALFVSAARLFLPHLIAALIMALVLVIPARALFGAPPPLQDRTGSQPVPGYPAAQPETQHPAIRARIVVPVAVRTRPGDDGPVSIILPAGAVVILGAMAPPGWQRISGQAGAHRFSGFIPADKFTRLGPSDRTGPTPKQN